MLNNKYIKGGIVVAVAVMAIYLMPIFFNWFAPFILAFIIAYASQRLVNLLQKKLKIPRAMASLIIIVLIIGVVGGVLALLIFRIFTELQGLVAALPQMVETFQKRIDVLVIQYSEFKNSLPEELVPFFDDFINGLKPNIMSWVNPLTQGTFKVAATLPEIVVFSIVTCVSTFFLTKDYAMVINFLRDLFPKSWQEKMRSFKDTILSTFFRYIKAQAILMTITFIHTAISLTIIRVDYALVVALCIGIADVFPVFSTSIVLVPWAVISFLFGDIYRGIALLVIQGICFLVRQLLEPRILSRQIGLYPLLTILAVYVGLKLFGFVGAFVGPIVMILIVNFYVSYKHSKDAQNGDVARSANSRVKEKKI